MRRLQLGINIDHVATLREARGTKYPDPIKAALDAEQAGADSITLHLREDRRHIQDNDVLCLRPLLQTRMNLEIATTPAMLDFALKVQPHCVCLVPEKREELTTEGGLNVVDGLIPIQHMVKQLHKAGIEVSLFVDPNAIQIRAACEVGAQTIEIHTGAYSDTQGKAKKEHLLQIAQQVQFAQSLGLTVNAGHGLNYHNVQPIAGIKGLNELNIGHAVVAHAIFVGFKEAVTQMRQLMVEACQSQ